MDPQDRPRVSHSCIQSGQELPKGAKNVPKAFQEQPKSRRECPKGTQERPKRAQERPGKAFFIVFFMVLSTFREHNICSATDV